VTLDGGGILYAAKITRQISLAKGQEINKCSTDSSASQKEHFVFPFQFLFARLSRVKRTLLLRNHVKILIFSEIFILQRYLRRYLVCPFNISPYIDLTENISEDVKSQTNLS
jgi:hypothetical protein